jgi:hypothetical protein
MIRRKIRRRRLRSRVAHHTVQLGSVATLPDPQRQTPGNRIRISYKRQGKVVCWEEYECVELLRGTEWVRQWQCTRSWHTRLSHLCAHDGKPCLTQGGCIYPCLRRAKLSILKGRDLGKTC